MCCAVMLALPSAPLAEDLGVVLSGADSTVAALQCLRACLLTQLVQFQQHLHPFSVSRYPLMEKLEIC